MKFKKFIYFGLFAVVLSGCSFKPTLPRKQIKFDSNVNSVKISDNWWEDFKDPTLNSFVKQSLKNNSDLAIALNNVDYARASLGLTKLGYAPNLTYKGDASRQNNYPLPPNANPHASYSLGATLSYEVDIWGKIRNNIEASKSKFMATKYDYEGTRLSIISNVVSMYYSLISAKEQEQILKSSLKAYEDILAFRQKQLNAGAINSVTFLQSKSQVDSAKTQLIDIENQISKLNTALSILVGKSYNEILNKNLLVKSNLPNPPIIPAGIPSDVLIHRPDVASALENLKASNFLVGAKKAEYFPSISLTGVLGYASGDFNRLFTTNSNSWSASGGLSGPLFDFGRTAKRVELANIEQKQSFLQYDKTLKSAFGDVKDALNNRENAKKEQEAMINLVNTEQKLYDAALQRFNAGYSAYLEVLDAQRSLLSAQLNLTKSKYQLIDSVVGVYKSLGGGFSIKNKENIELLNSNKTINPSNSVNPFKK